jgi:hypothetical protein
MYPNAIINITYLDHQFSDETKNSITVEIAKKILTHFLSIIDD